MKQDYTPKNNLKFNFSKTPIEDMATQEQSRYQVRDRSSNRQMTNVMTLTPNKTSAEAGSSTTPYQRDLSMSLNQNIKNRLNLNIVESKDGDQSSKFMPTPTKESLFNAGLKSRVMSSAQKQSSQQYNNGDLGHLKMTRNSMDHKTISTPKTMIHPLDG